MGTALDVTSCPGAETCRLGITTSKGLGRAIRTELLPLAANGSAGALEGVTIKVSGCPNACGQHHVANIGFHGVVKEIDGKQAPAYQLHLGGSTSADGAVIGRALVKLPARNVPGAVKALLGRWAAARRTPDEPFAEFASRLTDEELHTVLAPFADALPPVEKRHVDWGRTDVFTTDELGTGECAGGGEEAGADPFAA